MPSLDALLFVASATAPPLGSPGIDAWERSLDVVNAAASRTPGARGICSCALGEPY